MRLHSRPTTLIAVISVSALMVCIRHTTMGCAAASAEKPWKPLVFKMPRKKPPRVIETADDQYTLQMRERLKGLDVKATDPGQARAVSETKVDDLIAKETEDAKINGLYAMWYIDKVNDRAKEERVRPDKFVMRKRYGAALGRLDQTEVKEAPPTRPKRSEKGMLNLAPVQDMENLLESAHMPPPKPLMKGKIHMGTHTEVGESEGKDEKEEEEEEEEEEERISDYLEGLQKRYRAQDKVSKRVVKSPEQRRQEYEDTKLRMYAVTAGVGIAGAGYASVGYGMNEAFSFGLGSVAALAYLSGLSSYTDNAESPVGTALGGRRFLAPILLVLIVTGWEKIEARVEAIASLGLEPVLLPALLGFFTYSIGKVVGSMFSE